MLMPRGQIPCWGWFRLDIGKNVFMERLAQPWNRLPRKVVESPLLEEFQGPVDVAVGTWWPWQCWAGSWTGCSWRSFPTKTIPPFYDLAHSPCKLPWPWIPPNTDLWRESNLPAVELNVSLKPVQINSIKNGLKALFSLLNHSESCNETFWLDTLEVSDGNFLKWSISLHLSLALWYSGNIIFAPFRTKLLFKMSAWRRVCLWKVTISSNCISSLNKSYYLSLQSLHLLL